MKRAIVLSGGGTKGAYEAGFVRALKELNLSFDIVTGTSIGALNGALLVQHDEDRLIDLWDNMTMTRILKDELPVNFNIDEFLKESNRVKSFFKKYVKEKGADITPLKELIHEYYNEQKFKDSKIDFGLVTVEFPNLKYHYITKETMKDGCGETYLLASASCFPAFPQCEFNELKFIDGGYYDNLPIELAIQLGAKEIIAVDLNDTPNHPQFVNKPNIHYILPSFSLGSFLNFEKNQIDNNITLGYYDTMKSFGKLDGLRYTFKKVEKYPDFFNLFYYQLLIYDHKLTKQLLISADGAVTSKLYKMTYKGYLTLEEMNFAIMDYIMMMFEMNPYKLYDLDETVLSIQDFFAEAFKEDYELLPDLNVKEIMKAIQTLDKKEMIMKFVHYLCFPKKGKLPWSIILNVFSFEVAMALWIVASKGIQCRWEEL